MLPVRPAFFFIIFLFLLVGATPRGNAQLHASCYLASTGQLNSGSNPSDADAKAAMQALAIERGIPFELAAALAYQESGIRQFASDGYLLHNVSECMTLFQTGTGPNPPGLGMMQLTGSTATGFNTTKLRTDWYYNLAAGFTVLQDKFSIVKSLAPPSTAALMEANRLIIETWYMPTWFYNGYVGNFGSFPNTVFGHINNKPGKLAGVLPSGLSVGLPDSVIAHFFDSGFGGSFGEYFAVSPSGMWSCQHGFSYSGPAHATALQSLSAYGAGTSGCNGTHLMGASAAPAVGGMFTLTSDHAPANSLGLLLIGDIQDVLGSDPPAVGVKFHVSLSSPELYAFDLSSGTSGFGSLSFMIANNPSLIGLDYYAQAVWAWSGTCSLPPYGFSSSKGLRMVIQPSGGGSGQEFVLNGSFTSGTSGWSLSGDFWAGTTFLYYKTPPGYSAGGVDPGGVAKNFANGSLTQTISIPTAPGTATLWFWHNITTNEVDPIAYDFLQVRILNSAGTVVLATPITLSNLNNAPLQVYSQVSANLSAFKGQTIKLQFLGTTDVSLTTTFRIDDVSLIVN